MFTKILGFLTVIAKLLQLEESLKYVPAGMLVLCKSSVLQFHKKIPRVGCDVTMRRERPWLASKAESRVLLCTPRTMLRITDKSKGAKARCIRNGMPSIQVFLYWFAITFCVENRIKFYCHYNRRSEYVEQLWMLSAQNKKSLWVPHCWVHLPFFAHTQISVTNLLSFLHSYICESHTYLHKVTQSL